MITLKLFELANDFVSTPHARFISLHSSNILNQNEFKRDIFKNSDTDEVRSSFWSLAKDVGFQCRTLEVRILCLIRTWYGLNDIVN